MLLNLLSKAATVAMLCFVVSSMLATGAGLTVARIIEPLRNVRLVFLALLANFVLMPAGALALAKVLRLDEPFGVGFCCSVARPAHHFSQSSLSLPKATWRSLLVLWCC
jgi:predicted Na+-dependent transporter